MHYLLKEFDRTELKDPAAGNCLKKFYSRAELGHICAEQQFAIRVRDVRDLDEDEDQEDSQKDEDEDAYG
jgi:hypothetical protein